MQITRGACDPRPLRRDLLPVSAGDFGRPSLPESPDEYPDSQSARRRCPGCRRAAHDRVVRGARVRPGERRLPLERLRQLGAPPPTGRPSNGTSWITAGSAPSSSNNVITVQSGHTMTVSSTVTVDQVVINAGGQIRADRLDADDQQRIRHRPHRQRDLPQPGRHLRQQWLDRLQLRRHLPARRRRRLASRPPPGTPVPRAKSSRTTTTLPSTSTLAQSFANFTWNCTGQTTTSSFGSNLTTITGTLTLISSGSSTMLTSNSNSLNMTIGGDVVIQGGSWNFSASRQHARPPASGELEPERRHLPVPVHQRHVDIVFSGVGQRPSPSRRAPSIPPT